MPVSDSMSYWKRLRRDFFTGFLVISPLAVTVFLLWKGFRFLDGLLGRSINYVLKDVLQIIDFFIPGLGLIALIVILTAVGFATRNVAGQWLLKQSKVLLGQIPLVNRIYASVDQISQAIFSGKREVFKKAVLIQYPRKGIYSIAIMTADTGGDVQDNLPEDSLSVFLPTTPNPTSGFLLFIPKNEIIELNISVEEALKLIISGGTIAALNEKQIQKK